ncbi:hypothetical protein K469DRAFT_716345 [Zopfia rhizophila CBS 207.26]|uniref:Inositol-pentakisphosphate 2-kinase n=1 Tax=Zopfia rhizophila CBS 207.26 TaxID=1314779 RepID=A0A6A6DK78_9PEZI|nr:hypothetical protein K469DRAFT_716345 [Zopfia rhizophila CBS 207.26]
MRCRQALDKIDYLNAVFFQYLAEGAANVVFSITDYHSQLSPFHRAFVFTDDEDGYVLPSYQFYGKVIRVPKDNEHTLDGQRIKDGFENDVKPLFRNGFLHHLMEHEPVEFDSHIAMALDLELRYVHSDGTTERPRRHEGAIRHETQIALLMTNMSSTPGTSFTIEFKPKWLVQSPNAPRNAYRCRTCAMRAYANWKEKEPDEENKHPPAKTYICPLYLFNGDEQIVGPWVHEKILQLIPSFVNPGQEDGVVGAITTYLTKGDGFALLQHLGIMQKALDPIGVLNHLDATGNHLYSTESNESDLLGIEHQLRLAMTLRDCSMFVKVYYSRQTIAVESKLGDLDFKSVEKVPGWIEKEKRLVEGGFYMGKEGDAGMNASECCLIATEFRRNLPYHW